jgi:hypothetical protein
MPPEVNKLTPQEEQLLNSLVERVNQTQLQEKDPEAEELLNQRFGSNPDAIYILAQTVLVQNIALEQAKAQVAQLQQQVQQQRPQPAHTTSFLGRLLGERDAQPAAPQPPTYQPVNPQYAQPAPQYAQPQYQQPQSVPVSYGQPSFLRGAMQTAAGVAAGALAFEGVEAILHGMGGGWGGPGYGVGGFGGGFGRPVEETVINNYYDEPGRGAEHGGEHHLADSASQFSDRGGEQLSDAADDRGDNLRGFERDNSTGASDFDDTSLNEQSDFDDNGSFDDGGGFDGGDTGSDGF